MAKCTGRITFGFILQVNLYNFYNLYIVKLIAKFAGRVTLGFVLPVKF